MCFCLNRSIDYTGNHDLVWTSFNSLFSLNLRRINVRDKTIFAKVFNAAQIAMRHNASGLILSVLTNAQSFKVFLGVYCFALNFSMHA